MKNIPHELKYSTTHEWLRTDDNGVITVGITDHAQDLLGDLVFVDLPQTGYKAGVGDEIGVVESVKAASDLYCPVSGEIVEINEALNDAPDLINIDPYGDGWIFKIRPTDVAEIKEFLDADAYTEMVQAEETH